MRRFILITAMVLASATAQAGQSRNLSPVAANDQPPAVTTTVQPKDQPKAAEADISKTGLGTPQLQERPTPPAPPAPPAAPAFEERPPAVTPATTDVAPPLAMPPTPTVTTTDTPPAKADAPRKTAKADRGRRGRGNWTEARIIGELHRYGVYW
jgi:hypothetical protein